MSLIGMKSRNHPAQMLPNGGPVDDVDDRATTPLHFATFEEELGVEFTVDVAAASHNAKCERYYTREQNGLRQSWAGEIVWCNPPYSAIEPWIRKAWEERDRAELIAMLLPANRTEQRWWQQHVEPFRDRPGSGLTVRFLPGRMRFIKRGQLAPEPGDRPPFGCCLLVWRPTS